MNNTLERDDWWATPPEVEQRTRLHDGWLWSLSVFVAWCVFEITAHSWLAAIVLCLKFGFKSASTGWWLMRRDPRLARGWACLLFYLAAAGWKSTIAGFALAAIFAYIDLIWGNQGAAAASEIYVVLHVGWISFAACCVVSVLGMVIASRAGVRVWLDGRVYDSCQAGCWPPTTFRGNSIREVVVLTQTVIFLLGTAVLFLMAMVVRDQFVLMMLLLFVAPLLLAILVLVIPERILMHISARIPEECWPELGGEPMLTPQVFVPRQYIPRQYLQR
jgi:hypothetical protein